MGKSQLKIPPEPMHIKRYIQALILAEEAEKRRREVE